MHTIPDMPQPPSLGARRPPSRTARKGTTRRAPTAGDRFFRHIVSSMRNGVIAIHRDGSLALMNDEAYRVFGLSRDPGDIGRAFSEVLHERAEIIRVLSSAFELSTLPNRADLRLRDMERVIGYTLSQVKDDTGRDIGAVLFFKDLTQVEQIEERERLRDRLASLGEMAAGIAHDLRNPLAGIEVMAGLLRRQVPASPDAQSLLNDIMSEAKLANAIVSEMLDYVRPIRLQVESTDLVEVVHQAISLAETKAKRGDVTVEIDIAPGLAVECDPHQLCQVFTNLVANAFDAMDGRGEITVTALQDQMEHDSALARDHGPTPTVTIDVTDNGPGVPSDLADKIFNPFVTTKPQGSGLGLAIVRKIVDAHDGRIDLNSTPETGTRFRITLPVTSTSGWYRGR